MTLIQRRGFLKIGGAIALSPLLPRIQGTIVDRDVDPLGWLGIFTREILYIPPAQAEEYGSFGLTYTVGAELIGNFHRKVFDALYRANDRPFCGFGPNRVVLIACDGQRLPTGDWRLSFYFHKWMHLICNPIGFHEWVLIRHRRAVVGVPGVPAVHEILRG